VAPNADYVHGYSDTEAQRLRDQAESVRDLLHHDTRFPAGSLVLEAGCGVGAQTVTLAMNSPDAKIVSIDHDRASLDAARQAVTEAGPSNVTFQAADIFDLPFATESFDHIFVCFILEHMKQPADCLTALAGVLKKGGTITVIEGDHGSCYFHPATENALRVWNCLIQVQTSLGANPLIGRQLYPLLDRAGFRNVEVTPRMVYADEGRPELMEIFVSKTIVPMVEGVQEQAIDSNLIDHAGWRNGIDDLNRIAEQPGGTFCYNFFKATGVK